MFARVNDIFINKHPYVYKTLTWLSKRVDMKETKRKYLFLTWCKSGLHELICELLSKWLSYFLLLRSNMIISSQKAFISYRNFDILQAQQCETWKITPVNFCSMNSFQISKLNIIEFRCHFVYIWNQINDYWDCLSITYGIYSHVRMRLNFLA